MVAAKVVDLHVELVVPPSTGTAAWSPSGTLSPLMQPSIASPQMEGMVNDLQMAKERERQFEGEQLFVVWGGWVVCGGVGGWCGGVGVVLCGSCFLGRPAV